jgi:hypothetical protein
VSTRPEWDDCEGGKCCGQAQAIIDWYEGRVVGVLAHLYQAGAGAQVASLCDEELDPSGALLGRVRERVYALAAEGAE